METNQLFGKAKAKKRLEQEQRERDRVLDAQSAAQAWHSEVVRVESVLQMTTFTGVSPDIVDTPFVAKKGESVYAILHSAELLEPVRGPGQWKGSATGVSVRVAKGVTLRSSGTRGTYVQGATSQEAVDRGTAIITNQRVVFLGSQNTREWAYSKLVGVTHDTNRTVWLQVSNRQKASGIRYLTVVSGLKADLETILDLALSDFREDRDEMVRRLEARLSYLKANPPGASIPTPPDSWPGLPPPPDPDSPELNDPPEPDPAPTEFTVAFNAVLQRYGVPLHLASASIDTDDDGFSTAVFKFRSTETIAGGGGFAPSRHNEDLKSAITAFTIAAKAASDNKPNWPAFSTLRCQYRGWDTAIEASTDDLMAIVWQDEGYVSRIRYADNRSDSGVAS